MGTNYYAMIPGANPCEHCGRSDDSEEIHIGKSSAGWCFTLHVIPERDINTLEDWKAIFYRAGVKIRNEYRQPVTPEQMLHEITERSWPHGEEKDDYWYVVNHAERGLGGLTRHRIDGTWTLGHGEGTWDYCAGEFS